MGPTSERSKSRNVSKNIVKPYHGPSRTDASLSILNIMISQSLDAENLQPSTLPWPVDLTYINLGLCIPDFSFSFKGHFSQNKSPKKFKAIH